ncbi:MAG: Crp/Fnr family transcriptional regulator [Bacteroidales bacterium]|nr:Crp/Fnr family transcriptional regulator [Bacteroidales bacterium]
MIPKAYPNKPLIIFNHMEQPFNAYKAGLNLDFLQHYCINHGETRMMKRGESFECVGEPSHQIGYIEKGCFKYMVRHETEQKDYITGFAFENEFVADYPNCLYGIPSEIKIEASMESKVHIINGSDLYRIFNDNTEMHHLGANIMEKLFKQIYTNYLDHYRLDARGRYERLLKRCPQIVQQLSLKDISSYLKLHPNTISKIRHDITFDKK